MFVSVLWGLGCACLVSSIRVASLKSEKLKSSGLEWFRLYWALGALSAYTYNLYVLILIVYHEYYLKNITLYALLQSTKYKRIIT